MYTLLQATSIIGIIVSVFLLVAIPLSGGVYYSELGSKESYTFLYNEEERTEARRRRILIRKWIFPAFALVLCFFLAFVTLAFVSSKNLSKDECLVNEGVWEEWDGGFQWECYNPNNIDQDNNRRIILD